VTSQDAFALMAELESRETRRFGLVRT
jgi:hypothetical protein